MEEDKQIEQLKKLRKPFDAHQISKLPKPTKSQTDEVRANFKAGIRCVVCGGWHHPNVIHLDYVGHAALTDRLLEVDPFWDWEPVCVDDRGFPMPDENGGMWIRLTVCGVTRLGYGDAQGKTGGDAVKERIGDALRNAAMRFGAALDLWHKGDLHQEEPTERPKLNQPEIKESLVWAFIQLANANDPAAMQQAWHKLSRPEQEALWKKLKMKEQTAIKSLLSTVNKGDETEQTEGGAS